MRTSDRIDRFLANEENKNTPKPTPCKTCEGSSNYDPSHNGSRACRNKHNPSIAAGGTAAHCTCAGCF